MNSRKVIMLCLLLTVGIFSAQAQDQGSIRLTGGLVYGEGVEELGFNVGGEYFVTDRIAAAPNFTYFFVSGLDVTQINVDAHYYLLKGPVSIYALFGYASFRVSADFGFGRAGVSDGGVNAGGGVVVPIKGRWNFLGQVKYASPASGQVLVQAGVSVRLN